MLAVSEQHGVDHRPEVLSDRGPPDAETTAGSWYHELSDIDGLISSSVDVVTSYPVCRSRDATSSQLPDFSSTFCGMSAGDVLTPDWERDAPSTSQTFYSHSPGGATAAAAAAHHISPPYSPADICGVNVPWQYCSAGPRPSQNVVGHGARSCNER